MRFDAKLGLLILVHQWPIFAEPALRVIVADGFDIPHSWGRCDISTISVQFVNPFGGNLFALPNRAILVVDQQNPRCPATLAEQASLKSAAMHAVAVAVFNMVDQVCDRSLCSQKFVRKVIRRSWGRFGRCDRG